MSNQHSNISPQTWQWLTQHGASLYSISVTPQTYLHPCPKYADVKCFQCWALNQVQVWCIDIGLAKPKSLPGTHRIFRLLSLPAHFEMIPKDYFVVFWLMVFGRSFSAESCAACVLPVDKPRWNTPSKGTANGNLLNVLQGEQGITAWWAKITKMSKQGIFGVLFLLVITEKASKLCCHCCKPRHGD